ncbi:MAG: acyl-CoA dehydratase activase [Peptococcaceae bacterium]|jgi:predicted CoA-substrate-specific enzyme activase|nr:acyl-CoA dehydratase activase [Peptococcaceae bacterium]
MLTAGLDIGSVSTNAVLLANGKLIASVILPSGYNHQETAERAWQMILQQGQASAAQLKTIVATGYGRYNVPFASKQISEISCIAKGARHWFPDVRTVIDVGGQDSKVIKLDSEGYVADFVMNDKCAAGTGRFIEVMAQALQLEVSALEQEDLLAASGAQISSICTVFAESEVISLIGQGVARPKIVKGLHQAVASRVGSLAKRLKLEEPLLVTGGVAKNQGVVVALAAELGLKLLVPEEPQLVGALGAALIAAQE